MISMVPAAFAIVKPNGRGEVNRSDIKEHMEVYASCGTKVGKVDHVEGDSIKLTRNDSPDGQHHRIPLSWVAKVHDHIHLDRDHVEVQNQWQPA